MKSSKVSPKKRSAQAMVEFAIALPILLALLYGILETGRYMFLYSSVVTASRQAVRYGSATGFGDNGVPRYQDCAGIKLAANNADYLRAFDDEDIHIFYDSGPGTGMTEYCLGGITTDPSLTSAILKDNVHRLVVRIDGDFIALVPKLVPFITRTVANGNPVTTVSARTVLLSVSIAASSTPVLNPSTPTFTPSATNTPTDTPTDTPIPTATSTATPVTYTATITNTPTITLSPTITFTPSDTPTPSNTPTPSFTPTASATPISNCNLVSHGPMTISGTTMSMTISNPTGVPLLIEFVTISWNHDLGHKNPPDKTLRLQTAALNGTFWTGNIYATSYTINPYNRYIPTGSSTITFTFHQDYKEPDGSESIFINIATNGCQLYPINSNN